MLTIFLIRPGHCARQEIIPAYCQQCRFMIGIRAQRAAHDLGYIYISWESECFRSKDYLLYVYLSSGFMFTEQILSIAMFPLIQMIVQLLALTQYQLHNNLTIKLGYWMQTLYAIDCLHPVLLSCLEFTTVHNVLQSIHKLPL